MLICDVDDFTAYQVAIHFSLPQSHLHNSTKAYPFSKCQNAKVSLDFQQPGQSAVNNDHIECKKQHLSASLFAADFGNCLHSARAPWIHQRPHLGGTVHPMLFEAPNESFDPPNGQGKDRSFWPKELPWPKTAPAPYLGHVALPARLKQMMDSLPRLLELRPPVLLSSPAEKPQGSNKRGLHSKGAKDAPAVASASFPPAHLLQLHSTKWGGQRKVFQSWSGDTGVTPWKAMNFTRWGCSFEKH